MARKLQTINAKQLALPGFTLTATGLVVDGTPTFAQWRKAGRAFRQFHGAIQWWIGDWFMYGQDANYKQYEEALEETGFDYQTLAAMKYVAKRFEVLRRRNTLSWSHHKEVASITDDAEQDGWIDLAEENGWSVKELRTALRAKRQSLAIEAAGKYPPGKFRVIYADPPWKYNDELIEGYGAAEHHYTTQSVEELCNLSDSSGRHVKELAGDDAVLFMWATSPLLDEAFPVIDAWGFEYESLFVWDKVRHNYGHYNSVRHEVLLIGTRGSCTPDSKELVDSVVSIERDDKHSHKLDQFYDIIDQMYPVGPRIELFARSGRDRWSAWGDESTKESV